MTTILNSLENHPVKYVLIALCLLVPAVIEIWESFSPLPASNWIATNIKSIRVADPEDFSFAVFGDNNSRNPKFENLLKLIDHDADISFVICLGDLVGFGAKMEYRYALDLTRKRLGIALLTVVGANELRGKGQALYHSIFGPPYYSFKIGNNYFIVLDDADRRGLGHRQIRWLEKELAEAQKYDSCIVFMQVPLYDPKGRNYGYCLSEESSDYIAELFYKHNVSHIFASYIYGHFEGDWNAIPYTISGGSAAGQKGDDPDFYFSHFLKIHLKKGKVDVEVKPVTPEDIGFEKLLYVPWAYTYALLSQYGVLMSLVLFVGLLVTRNLSLRKKRGALRQSHVGLEHDSLS